MGQQEQEEMMELGAAEASHAHGAVSPLDHLDDDKDHAVGSDRHDKDESEDQSEDEESEDDDDDDDDDDDNDEEEEDEEESEDENMEASAVGPKGE